MKKLLIICQNYPSHQNPFSQTFIHYRLKEYIKEFDVDVLSFASKEDYIFEGIKVFTESSLKNKIKQYDLIVSHAPNIRNHQRFILSNLFKIKKILFIFHGYEVIDIVKRVYSQPTHYEFAHSVPFLSRLYHKIKLPITNVFLKFIGSMAKCQYIFVSNSLLKEVEEDLNTTFNKEEDTFVVNNPINPIFHEIKFNSSKKYDFVCIRPFNDPKYGIDIFIKLAERNPGYSFHLYGRGDFPVVSKKPANLTVISKFIESDEMPVVLNDYKAAILPTRWDSQGVLACEIAAQGMPLITSDLQVCQEMLGRYKNVHFVKNDQFHKLDLNKLDFKDHWLPENIYSHQKTSHCEMQIINKMIQKAGAHS